MWTGAWTSAPRPWASKASLPPGQPWPHQQSARPFLSTPQRRSNSAIVLTFSLALISLALGACSAPGEVGKPAGGGNAVVTRVVDGDTVEVKIDDKKEKVRLIGIDTPETVDPNRPVGCYGKEASDFTKSLLAKNTSVTLVIDVEPRDKYGRLLAYVYRTQDNLFVNAELARLGYANVLTIPPNVAHSDEFVRFVDDARTAKLGLWATC